MGALGCPPQSVAVSASPAGLEAAIPAGDAAVACVAAALTAAAGLRRQRLRSGPAEIGLDAAHVAAAVRSEARVRAGGRSLGSGFAPLSRFWQAADGWVRTHGNYPWHAGALARALGADAEPAAVAAAISGRSAAQVEAEVCARGGVAAAVRTEEEWRAHPQGRAVASQPLVRASAIDGAPPRRRGEAVLPAAGLRVLDLTRVIAGPVATRYLAALGADVLRLDPPDRPELPLHRHDGLLGKRSALLDASARAGLRQLHGLLDGADVLVHGYRPGALDKFGLGAAALAERHPGLVVVSLSAWGDSGPWGARRGFDSIVQAASGIAMAESPDGGQPGQLPCQLLDHGTGYLAAAAAMEGVRRQSAEGGTRIAALSLAATAAWLLSQPRSPAGGAARSPEPDAARWESALASEAGPVTVIAPPGSIGGHGFRWPARLGSYGADKPAW